MERHLIGLVSLIVVRTVTIKLCYGLLKIDLHNRCRKEWLTISLVEPLQPSIDLF